MAAPQKDMTSKTVRIDPARNSGSSPGWLCSKEKRIKAVISNMLHPAIDNIWNHSRGVSHDHE